MIKPLTLCMIVNDGKILLGMKKRGFGAGNWNGFGGKLNPGETVEEALKREVKEEIGVTILTYEKRGLIHFKFKEKPEETLEVHIFICEKFEGKPKESEEMKPQWYMTDSVPYKEMWPDDKYWIPLLFAGKKFKGKFLFGPGNAILDHDLEVVSNIC